MAHSYLIKLVRDKIGDNRHTPGIKFAPIEDREEFIEQLRAKLMEEATEYLLKPSLSELGDVLTVLRTLAEEDLGLGKGCWTQVVLAAVEKDLKRGDFAEHTGMYIEEEESYT